MVTGREQPFRRRKYPAAANSAGGSTLSIWRRGGRRAGGIE